MLFRRTPQFKEDYEGLTAADKEYVDSSFPEVAEALQGNEEYFKKHKIKKMQGHLYIWEGHIRQNLCFTYHIDNSEEGEKICWFRRVGNHTIYNRP